jgi:hypothetical protein
VTSPNAGLQNALGGTSIPSAGANTGSVCFGNTTSGNAYGLVMGANSSGVGYISSQRTDGSATTYNLAIQPNGGNVGIGVTSILAGYKLEVDGSIVIPSGNILANRRADGGNFGLIRGNDSGTTILGDNQSVHILSSGNVGINETNPSSSISSNNTTLHISDSNVASLVLDQSTSGKFEIAADGLGLDFRRNGTNYLIINTSGNVGIGVTSPAYGLDVRRSSGAQFYHEVTNEATANIRCRHDGAETTSDRATQISFRDDGDNEVGSIKSSGSATFYNTSSDYRLKQNEKDFNGLDLVDNIKVYDFEWKKDGGKDYGVFAHELQEIVPEAVSGEKDAEEMQSVDYSKLVPILLKSIQELKQEIEILKNN